MRPSLNILEPELIGRIVDEAMRVLAETGMEIRGAGMRQRLAEHGLPTDPDGRVRFPRSVVEAAIASAPSSFWLYDRDGNPHADIGGDRVHFIPGSSGLKILDHRTGETRLAELRRTSWSTCASAMAWPTSRISPRPSPRTTTSRRRSRTPGACS